MEQLFHTAYQSLLIDPLAISVVLDTATRTGGKLKNCLCTLVGQILDDGSIHVTDAFVNHVILSEADNLALPERTHHDHMWQQRQKVDPREIILGWATTDLGFASLDAISEWARADQRESKFVPRKRLNTPLLMKIDMPTATSDLDIRVFTKGPIANCLLRPHPFTISQTAHGMDLGDPISGSLSTDGSNLQFLEQLIDRINKAITLVDEVIKGTRKADPELGRQLYKAVSPPMNVDLESLTKIESQDNLLAVYVSNLVKLQFAIGEKVNVLYA